MNPDLSVVVFVRCLGALLLVLAASTILGVFLVAPSEARGAHGPLTALIALPVLGLLLVAVSLRVLS